LGKIEQQHVFILNILIDNMEFDSVVYKRRSVRSFSGKKVDFRNVLDAIDAVIQGPFAGNINNLHFLIVEEKETIGMIAEHSDQSWIGEAGVVVLICSDDAHIENIYGERGRVYSRQQAGAAIQTFLLKLIDMGLAGCWVGAFSDEIIKENLKIPQNIQIEAIIPIGYEKKKPGTHKPLKKQLENILRWEDWDTERRPTLFEENGEPFSPPKK